MKSTLQVEAAGLVAAAERLRSAAAEVTDPAVVLHPPLAADHTSVAAAGRLSAVASALHASAADQAASLIATAEHLATIAAGFTAQEAANTEAVRALNPGSAPVASPGVLAPVPQVATDAPPPLSPPSEMDGEVVARQFWAGSASAGSTFVQSWRSRCAVAATARDGIRDVVSTLPYVWNSPSASDAVSARLMRHADAFAQISKRADALADQAATHAGDYSAAVANTPKPAEFEAVRAQLQQALDANAKFPGRYTPVVSSLIAKQGALRQQALNTQTEYGGQTEATTGTEQAGALAAALPGMVPGLLGAVGGLVGGAITAAAQLPQALMQTGQQLAQAATQGLSGLGTSSASGIGSATTGLDTAAPAADAAGAPAETGATSPAGAADTTPVAPSTASSPPPASTLPAGAQHSAVPATGIGGVPMGMPMGMLPTGAAAQPGAAVGKDKKIVVPVVPHTEPVTGRTTADRLSSRRIEDGSS